MSFKEYFAAERLLAGENTDRLQWSTDGDWINVRVCLFGWRLIVSVPSEWRRSLPAGG